MVPEQQLKHNRRVNVGRFKKRQILFLAGIYAITVQTDGRLMPKMKISQIIENENLENPEQIEFLRADIQQYLTTNITHRATNNGGQPYMQLSPTQLNVYFRNLEREENTRRILQYMLSFLTDIPVTINIGGEPINPVKQFKEFLKYQVALLLEKDVINTILCEYSKQGLLNPGNYWYYEARIMDKRLELEHMLAQIPDEQTATKSTLFQVLENLCLFWFDIGREDVRQARRSDIYMYKLACLLQSKLQKKGKSFAGTSN
jgi:hypothetical protein